ncbi:MAG: FAD:protein FMN transferase [Oscillospiraceae bacterium]
MKLTLKAAAVTAALLSVGTAVLIYKINTPKSLSFSGFYFDTAVTCSIKGGDGEVVSDCRALLKELDTSLSSFDKASAVYALNNGSRNISDENISALLKEYLLFEETFGYGVTPFCGSLTMLWNVTAENPKVPSENDIAAALEHIYPSDAGETVADIPDGAVIDFGAAAKGYACDRLLDIAEENNVSEIIFSSGSSSLLYSNVSGRTFTAAVTDPFGEGTICSFETESCFISTSGGYERFFTAEGKTYSHIIDTQTGYPAETDLASVTVILSADPGSSHGAYSDMLSTLIYMGGSEKAEDYADICGEYFPDGGFGIITVDESGNIKTYGNVNLISE